MPDITKCNNDQCPKKDNCYRFTSPSNDYQSFIRFEHENCEFYIANDETTRI